MVGMALPLPRYRPMLASAGVIRGRASEYAFEPKLDGWRALVTVVPGTGIGVRTRNGHDVTAALPELHGLLDAVAASGASGVVLDGELVAHDGHPRSFARLT